MSRWWWGKRIVCYSLWSKNVSLFVCCVFWCFVVCNVPRWWLLRTFVSQPPLNNQNINKRTFYRRTSKYWRTTAVRADPDDVFVGNITNVLIDQSASISRVLAFHERCQVISKKGEGCKCFCFWRHSHYTHNIYVCKYTFIWCLK